MKFGKDGLAKFGWFKMLYPSKRSSIFSLSVSCVLLKREKSNWRKCGPISELRPRVPKCIVLMHPPVFLPPLGPAIASQARPVGSGFAGLIEMQFAAAVPRPSKVHGTANEPNCRKLFGSF